MFNQYILKIKTAIQLIKTPEKMILPLGQKGLLNYIPDKLYLKAVFKAETGYKLNLKDPKTYNEKLQWIKLYDRKPEYIRYADKYRVREYITKMIGDQYLIPLIGVYQSVEEIPWNDLPERFVLKCNHTSGKNIICKDKKELDIKKAKDDLSQWLKTNAYWGGREWCYKDIKPCIICEQFLETEDGNTPDDYKFMCFNGTPKLIQVHHDRFGDHTLDYYTTDWEKTNLKRINASNSKRTIERPEKLSEMLKIATCLSQNMYYTRVDLYYTQNKIYFGEITLYPTSGFSTFASYDDDLLLGSYIHLEM